MCTRMRNLVFHSFLEKNFTIKVWRVNNNCPNLLHFEKIKVFVKRPYR